MKLNLEKLSSFEKKYEKSGITLDALRSMIDIVTSSGLDEQDLSKIMAYKTLLSMEIIEEDNESDSSSKVTQLNS